MLRREYKIRYLFTYAMLFVFCRHSFLYVKANLASGNDDNWRKIELQTQQKLRLKRNSGRAVDCDFYEAKTKICWFERQVGETLTISIHLKETQFEGNDISVLWRRKYKIYHKGNETIVNINKDNSPWNLLIGSGGFELRISPITDTDMDMNSFSAKVYQNKIKNNAPNLIGEVIFRINIIPIDMGVVYPGEEAIINIEKHISLPAQSLFFEWFIEDEHRRHTSMPSNMKVSRSGKSLSIREFRSGQEGIISCAIYSSRKVFVAKRRFRIQCGDCSSQSDRTGLTPSEKEYLREKILNVMKKSAGNFARNPYRRTKRTAITKINSSYFYSKGRDANAKVEINRAEMHQSESSLVSQCLNKQQCGQHAQCQILDDGDGYCKCSSGYHGNGLFCWEDVK